MHLILEVTIEFPCAVGISHFDIKPVSEFPSLNVIDNYHHSDFSIFSQSNTKHLFEILVFTDKPARPCRIVIINHSTEVEILRTTIEEMLIGMSSSLFDDPTDTVFLDFLLFFS